jgi:hypothetical protein
MRKTVFCFVFALVTAGAVSMAAAGELSIKIANGRATVIAKDVPVRQILAEWARVGETKVVNGERIPGGPISLELVDVPEKEALDTILRTAAGYITAPRPANLAGASQFDRVIVLATSRPPAANATVTPPAFGRPAMQMPPQPPPDDDDGEPGDQGMPPPVIGPNGPVQSFPGAPNTPPVGPNGQILGPNGTIMGPNGPIMIGPNGVPIQQPAPPATGSRPGQLPAAQPQLPNPYAPAGRPVPSQGRPGGEGQNEQ